MVKILLVKLLKGSKSDNGVERMNVTGLFFSESLAENLGKQNWHQIHYNRIT